MIANEEQTRALDALGEVIWAAVEAYVQPYMSEGLPADQVTLNIATAAAQAVFAGATARERNANAVTMGLAMAVGVEVGFSPNVKRIAIEALQDGFAMGCAQVAQALRVKGRA